jgi:DNA modification methylase
LGFDGISTNARDIENADVARGAGVSLIGPRNSSSRVGREAAVSKEGARGNPRTGSGPMLKTPTANTLFYGDNRAILRAHVDDKSVDLIYLDPPFNSNASYNVLFKAPDGHQSQAQIEAFDDTWHWNEPAERAFDEVMQSGNSDAAEMLRAMRSFLKENDMMAYITMMAVRLLELHRVLKPTGSLYLHCDPTASHYLKAVLDAIFGPYNFRSEIIWKRTSSHNSARRWGPIHDTILFYSKSKKFAWNRIPTRYDQKYIKRFYWRTDANGRRYRMSDLTESGVRHGESGRLWNGFDPTSHGRHWAIPSIVKDDFPEESSEELSPHGWLETFNSKGLIEMTGEGIGWPHVRRYLDRMSGQAPQDVITDIAPLSKRHAERLGYPTQKPLALLERIVSASSNEGDLVLDPFCGCGTTVHAAQKLSRRWIGIDITHLAIHLIQRRLKDAFPGIRFDIFGEPKDLDGARVLALQDKYEFQKWALAMIGAQPFKGGKKGGDGGVDGFLYIKPDGKTTEKVIVSVKGGQSLNPGMVKDLIVTVDQDGAKMGIFLTLEPPTKGMVTQAAAAGFFKTDYGQFPKIQIVTVEELFGPSNPLHLPWQDTSVFKKAKREQTETQSKLDL